ncbi:T9SS type A sorting domain-containing protein [Flavobacterium sp.]|uniref:T9SS type A sorting domain-containing protein n=1 Tax=Flavobacterium sp. TaxID=239 RepID=UPI003752BFC7
MKKLYSLLFLVVTAFTFGQTIYTENFGTPTGNTTVANYITGTAPATFQNSSPIVYSGTTGATSLRVTSVSSGYTGVSGNGNVFLSQTTNVGHFFQVDGINTSAYTSANLQLSFGYLTSATTSQLILEKSTDGGTNWSPITFTNNTTTTWNLVTIGGGQIPSTTTLSLRFTQPSTVATPNSTQFRIDDLKVYFYNAACTLVLSTPTSLCDAVTFGTDTYTATIPYTGGGTGSYTITPSSGTVGGDNPATVAAGNIVISGISEGTALTLNVVSGVCSYSANLNSPECKPVNTLPLNEPFNYTVGNTLGSSQRWSNANTGDDISVVTGNLSYTGLTSSGNSVSLGGDGKECHTPFTATTSTDGNLFASFLIKVTDYANVTTDGNQDYFVVLTDGVSSNFKSRLFIKKTATQYQLGLTSGTSTTNYDPTLFNVGDVVLVVLGYDFTGNTLKAWFNPVLASFTAATTPNLTDTPTAAISTLGGFLLRQGTTTTTPSITVDELRIATTTAQLLSVNQNTISGLKVYPNPVSNGTLFIETSANAEKTVTIFDVMGKQVLNTTSTSNEINVASIKGGIYLVKITEEGKTATRKLVIE